MKWVIQAVVVGCPCGCDQEVYWGDYCGSECEPCDHCGNFIGGGPVDYSSQPVEGGYVPQSGMMVQPTQAPCNCNHGGVSQSDYRYSRQTVAVRQAQPSYATRYPAASDQGWRPVRNSQAVPASYASDTRYASYQRPVPSVQPSAQPRYTSEPSVEQTPAYSQSPRYSGESSPDMFRPRLISVTDRVVKPAEAAPSETQR
jgi:hypothetical protein